MSRLAQAPDADTPEQGVRFLRHAQLKDYGIPYSRQHLTVLEANGKFPRRVKLSDRFVAWRLDEILDWMRTRGRA